MVCRNDQRRQWWELVKTKVFSMMAGDGVNVTDNAYRVTLDKRPSVNCGAFRFTMRSRGRDAGEPNAGCNSWSRSNFYLFKFEWRGGRADASVFDGGVNGFLKARPERTIGPRMSLPLTSSAWDRSAAAAATIRFLRSSSATSGFPRILARRSNAQKYARL